MKVKVFKTRTCSYCPSLFKYLNNKQIDYEVVDCTDDPKRLERVAKLSGVYSVPQTLVGDEVVVGLNYGKLSDLLRKNGLMQ